MFQIGEGSNRSNPVVDSGWAARTIRVSKAPFERFFAEALLFCPASARTSRIFREANFRKVNFRKVNYPKVHFPKIENVLYY